MATPSAGPRLLPRIPAVDAILLASITLAAALLRVHAIAAKSFWFDEGVSVAIARLDWYNFLRILWRREANMSLYYFFLHLWLHFGHSEFFVRALSVVFAVATIPVIYFVAHQLFGSRAALIAAALLGVNAYHVRYSQEARSYTLMTLLCTASSLYFLKRLELPSRRNRVAYIILSSAAVYAHFYSALLIVGHWLSLRLLRPEAVPKGLGRDWRWIALVISPIILFIATTGAGPLRWIQRPGIKDLWELAIHLSGNGGAILSLLYLLACGAAIVPALRRIGWPSLQWEQWRYWFLLVWLFFPLLFILAVSLVRPLFLARYFILSLPALVLLAAAGLSRIPNRVMLTLALLPFMALSLRGTLSYYGADFDIQRDDWRGASNYLLTEAQPADGLVFFVAMGRMPYEYYYWLRSQPVGYPALIYPYHGPRTTFLDFVEKPDYRTFGQDIGRYQRIWFVISHANTGAHEDKPLSALSNLIGIRCGGFEEKDFEGVKLRLYRCGDPEP